MISLYPNKGVISSRKACSISHESDSSYGVIQINWILFPTVYFIGKYILVLDRDKFRLALDYMSIMHILVKVLSNQDSATRMVLEPVRMQILSLAMVA